MPGLQGPVFKAVREAMPAQLHYLSHYVAAKAYAADCELRVGGFSTKNIDHQNVISRGQKIELFMRVLRDAINRFEYADYASPKIKQIFWLAERSHAVATLCDVFSAYAHLLPEDGFRDCVQQYIYDDVGAEHPMWRTGFAIEVQRRIGFDVWRSLVTPPFRKNLQFLFRHGYLMVLSRLQASLDQGTISEPSRLLRNFAERLFRASRADSMALLDEMLNTPAPEGFAEPGIDYRTKLISEINYEMWGCVIRLPYFKILEEQQQKNVKH